MSMNNYILIEEITPDEFRVSNVDAEGSGGFHVRDEPFTNLREAIRFAQEQESEYGVQIQFLPPDKQKMPNEWDEAEREAVQL